MNRKKVVGIGRIVGAALLALSLALVPVKSVSASTDVVEWVKTIAVGNTSVENGTLTSGNGRYIFTVAKSGTLTAQIGFLEGSKYSWGHLGDLALYDADNKKLTSVGVRDRANGTDSEVFTYDIMAGKYYLQVEPDGSLDKQSKFTLMTTFEESGETYVDSYDNPHSNVGNTLPLASGQEVVGHIADNGTEDWYQLNMKNDGMLTIRLNCKTDGIRLVVTNYNNTVNESYSWKEKNNYVKFFCPKGTCYITVAKRDGGGRYNLKATATKIPETKIKKLGNKRGKWMTVKFALKSLDDVSGYQIQYTTDKKFKKGKKLFNVDNQSYTKATQVISVKAKKKYYVRIRTYVNDARQQPHYSKWSKAKSVNIVR